MNKIDTINVIGISFLLIGQGCDNPETKIKPYESGYLGKWHLVNEVFSQKGYKPDQHDVNKFSREFVSTLPLEHCKPAFLEEKNF